MDKTAHDVPSPALLIGGTIVLACVGFTLIRRLGVGPTPAQSSWPTQCRLMVDAIQTDTSDAKVYVHTSFIDSEAVWRLTLSGEQLEKVIALNELPSTAIKYQDSSPQRFPYGGDPSPTRLAVSSRPRTSRGADKAPTGTISRRCTSRKAGSSTCGTKTTSDEDSIRTNTQQLVNPGLTVAESLSSLL